MNQIATAAEKAIIRSKMSPQPTERRVVDCYSVFDAIFPACGFTDLTDGMYEGEAGRGYETAQARQAEVLLDRARVGPGSRLLDVGCGYGRILDAAAARGARARGITVSPEQVRRNVRAGREVYLLDYRHLGPQWNGQFDAVVANGSLEHFAQPADAAAGADDAIYRHLFATVGRLLEEKSPAGRFVTTAIHFRDRPNPLDLLHPASDVARGSAVYHWLRISRSFGGWYPTRGQLEACARGTFELVHEEDGTEDYRRTSEQWLSGVRRQLLSPRCLAVVGKTLPVAVRRPVQTAQMLRCMLGSESWNWQFRGNPPPTLLLRQTWQRL